MALESGTYISDLVPTNPAASDGMAQGDDHIRLIKATLKASFPNITGPVTATQDDLNAFDGRLDAVEGSYLKKDGSVALTGDLNLGSKKIVSLADPAAAQDAATKKYVDDKVAAIDLSVLYPVGSLYFNASSSVNPATLLGFGTWEAFGEGRVLIGVGSTTDARGENKSFTLGQTGGEYRHVQTVAEMAKHGHPWRHYHVNNATTNLFDESGGIVTHENNTDTHTYDGSASDTAGQQIGGAGQSQPMNITQPYIAVYIWKRTA